MVTPVDRKNSLTLYALASTPNLDVLGSSLGGEILNTDCFSGFSFLFLTLIRLCDLVSLFRVEKVEGIS